MPILSNVLTATITTYRRDKNSLLPHPFTNTSKTHTITNGKHGIPTATSPLERRRLRLPTRQYACSSLPTTIKQQQQSHANSKTPQPTENQTWHFASASEEGFPLSAAPIPNRRDECWDMGPRTFAFLANILGKGGRLEGW